MHKVRYTLLSTMTTLEEFIPQWIALHVRDAHATPFQHPAWLVPWWRQFGSEELCAVAILTGDSLCAFLPLYIYTEPGTAERKLMLLGVGTSDYLGGVYSPECSANDVAEALRWLANQTQWHTLSLVQLRSGSLLLEAARNLGGRLFVSEACSQLPASAIAGLTSKIRRNAMYYRNVAQRRGVLELSIAEPSNCVCRFDELVRLHTERWRGRCQPGVLDDQRVLAWHREAIPLLAGAGLLRLYSLVLIGKTIAAMYAIADPPERARRSVYLYLPGFSTSHAELRPGTLLMAAAIEHAACEGMATIDLLRGNEAYKQHWRAERVETYGCAVTYERFTKQVLSEPVVTA